MGNGNNNINSNNGNVNITLLQAESERDRQSTQSTQARDMMENFNPLKILGALGDSFLKMILGGISG